MADCASASDAPAPRKMASIRFIQRISDVPESTSGLRIIGVDGWNVVQRLEADWDVGSNVVFCEIDSFVPSSVIALDPVSKYLGVMGTRIQSRKVLGHLSQGLILPLTDAMRDLPVGTDVSEKLGIVKWERVDRRERGEWKGRAKQLEQLEQPRPDTEFPSHLVPKTDQERAQNLVTELFGDESIAADSTASADSARLVYEATVKLDGSSITCYHHEGHIGVCSRNRELSKTSTVGSVAWETCRRDRLIDALEALRPRNLAFQGEHVGPKIQNNPLGLAERRLYLFDVYDIDARRYLLPGERHELLLDLNTRFGIELRHVPVLDEALDLRSRFSGLDALLEFADATRVDLAGDGKARRAEGVVFKATRRACRESRDGRPSSFKIISNAYIAKHPDLA